MQLQLVRVTKSTVGIHACHDSVCELSALHSIIIWPFGLANAQVIFTLENRILNSDDKVETNKLLSESLQLD